MALNTGKLVDVAFDALSGAASMAMHAYSGFTLVFIVSAQRGEDMKHVRKMLSAQAAATGVIAANTWESYVKSIDTAAKMFLKHAPEEIATIRDMVDEAEAVDGMRVLYEGLNILSGGDIRLWATAGKFEPLNKEAMKAAKAAAAKEAKAAKAAEELAMFRAQTVADSSSLNPSEAAAAGTDDVAAALASLIGRLTPEQLVDAVGAINTRLDTLRDVTKAANAVDGAKAVAPVLPDNVEAHPLSAVGRVKAA